jgi:hypothetical protein
LVLLAAASSLSRLRRDILTVLNHPQMATDLESVQRGLLEYAASHQHWPADFLGKIDLIRETLQTELQAVSCVDDYASKVLI